MGCRGLLLPLVKKIIYKNGITRLTNVEVTVKDFATDIKTSEGTDHYVVLIDCQEGECKFFTNNDKMKQALDMASEKNMLPFTTTIKADGGYGYIFT